MIRGVRGCRFAVSSGPASLRASCDEGRRPLSLSTRCPLLSPSGGQRGKGRKPCPAGWPRASGCLKHEPGQAAAIRDTAWASSLQIMRGVSVSSQHDTSYWQWPRSEPGRALALVRRAASMMSRLICRECLESWWGHHRKRLIKSWRNAPDFIMTY